MVDNAGAAKEEEGLRRSAHNAERHEQDVDVVREGADHKTHYNRYTDRKKYTSTSTYI